MRLADFRERDGETFCADHHGRSSRPRLPGATRLAVIGAVTVLSWMPLVAVGYACSVAMG